MYNTLIASRVTAAAYISLPNPTVTDSIWAKKRTPGTVTIAGLFYQYAYLDSTALANNKITVIGNQLFDKYVGGVWQNPYLIGKMVGFAPATESYMGQYFDIVLPDSLWLSNSKNSVDHIELDPGDGIGYRTISPNIPLSVEYPDTGLKAWNFKVYLTNNTVLVSHSRIQINEDIFAQNANLVAYNTILASSGITTGRPPATPGFYYVNSTESFGGERGFGTITIQYADPSTHIIHKPLIVAEGFDQGVITNPESYTGNYSLTNFQKQIRNSNSSNLTSLMLDQGLNNYDIIFIDFRNCLKDLRVNALIVKDVIRWVNAQKQPLPGNTISEKNVVMGLSEGGVIARYALKKMEDASENADTKLFVSVDAPQQGSVAPFGFQYALNHFNNFYMRLGDIPNLYNIFRFFSPGSTDIASGVALGQSPAAKQMLQYHLDENDNVDNSTHIAWQNELTALGYPSCRCIAISNGSECGLTQPGAAPGSQLLLVNGEYILNFGAM